MVRRACVLPGVLLAVFHGSAQNSRAAQATQLAMPSFARYLRCQVALLLGAERAGAAQPCGLACPSPSLLRRLSGLLIPIVRLESCDNCVFLAPAAAGPRTPAGTSRGCCRSMDPFAWRNATCTEETAIAGVWRMLCDGGFF